MIKIGNIRNFINNNVWRILKINIKEWVLGNEQQFIMCIVLIILVIIFTILNPVFITKANILNIIRLVSITGITAMGMTLVIISGGIDLSVGSIFALSGVISTGLLGTSYTESSFAHIISLPVPLAIIIGILVGVILGSINGLIISKTKIPPFVATLGMMSFIRGLVYLYTHGYPITFNELPTLFGWVGGGYILTIPTAVIIFLIVIIICWFILNFTNLGRSIFAVGGNSSAARMSGINVDKIYLISYSILGCLAAISGIIMASRTASGSPIAGQGFEFDAITAVILGGTSLRGGRGSLFGTIIGVLIMGTLITGLNIIGVQAYYQWIVKGLALILAVSLDTYIRRRRRNY